MKFSLLLSWLMLGQAEEQRGNGSGSVMCPRGLCLAKLSLPAAPALLPVPAAKAAGTLGLSLELV